MRALLLGVVFSAAACGGGTDYFGLDPDEAAAEAADRACDQAYRCGLYTIDCDPTVTATRDDPSTLFDDRAACDAEIASFYVDFFVACAAAGLTDDEREAINDCLNTSVSCMSDSELQAYAEAVCEGETPPGNDTCARAQPAFDRCYDCLFDPDTCG